MDMIIVKRKIKAFLFKDFDKAISESSNYTALEINYKKGLMVQMEKSYGNRITSTYSLGYMQSEALISIMGKSPNNTFPIFWKAKHNFNIFPRFKIMKTEIKLQLLATVKYNLNVSGLIEMGLSYAEIGQQLALLTRAGYIDKDKDKIGLSPKGEAYFKGLSEK